VFLSPCTLHPTPYTLRPTPHAPHPTPPHPTPYTLHPTPCTPHPASHTLNPHLELTLVLATERSGDTVPRGRGLPRSKKRPPPLGTPKGPRHCPTAWILGSR
jgi:hypothetical protein